MIISLDIGNGKQKIKVMNHKVFGQKVWVAQVKISEKKIQVMSDTQKSVIKKAIRLLIA